MYDDSVTDTAKITVIATGLNDATAKQASVSRKEPADARKSAFPAAASLHRQPLRYTLLRKLPLRYSRSHSSGASRSGTGSADHDKQCSEKGHPDPGFLKKPQISKE